LPANPTYSCFSFSSFYGVESVVTLKLTRTIHHLFLQMPVFLLLGSPSQTGSFAFDFTGEQSMKRIENKEKM
jgi:hypothetical protein